MAYDNGSAIVVSTEPRGVFKEGYVSGTPKPGTVMQLKASTEPIGGRYTWEVYDKDADGNRGLLAILCEDRFLGRLTSEAYADGDRCFLYVPVPGEELNMLVADVSGTADDVAIGDTFIVDDGTGLLIATTGTPESEPFQALETINDKTADQLVHCVYTGY